MQKTNIMIVQNTTGGVFTLRGFFDTCSRKFYPWSLETLLLLCKKRVYLEEKEIVEI
jgi:hypothetical protein